MRFAFLFIAFIAFGCIKEAYPQSAAASIKQARAEVAAINKASKGYKKIVVKNVEGISLEGAEASYFIAGNAIRKIKAKAYGEAYQATIDIYYSGEEMIFAYIRMGRYRAGLGSPIASIEEKRVYFEGGKMIKLIAGKLNIEKGSSEWENSASEIAGLGLKLRQAYLARP